MKIFITRFLGQAAGEDADSARSRDPFVDTRNRVRFAGRIRVPSDGSGCPEFNFIQSLDKFTSRKIRDTRKIRILWRGL